MRFGVPDSKSINGEFEFEESGEGGREKSRQRGTDGDHAYVFWSTRAALPPCMPSEHVMVMDA